MVKKQDIDFYGQEVQMLISRHHNYLIATGKLCIKYFGVMLYFRYRRFSEYLRNTTKSLLDSSSNLLGTSHRVIKTNY